MSPGRRWTDFKGHPLNNDVVLSLTQGPWSCAEQAELSCLLKTGNEGLE